MTSVRPGEGRVLVDSPHSTDSSVYGNHAPVQRVDHHDHGGRAIALAALIIACIGLGALLMYVVMDGRLDEAKLAASSAQIQQAVQQQVSDAKAAASSGREHARIALAEVQRANAQLEAKGLINPALH